MMHWPGIPGIRNRYGAVRCRVHEGTVTICRQNGCVMFAVSGRKRVAF
ncbi:hypothetical protein DESPIG_00250 [Desulfovibrio piger ATCC 29098]|uniref:Uncharacterized protein n=1 Tax=Desulfovibrio piger ATCC 29098 TaxID=411464 RepID=B6WQD0_9BACT|nr:hypothetical protein DESPIG_00250 [Desulfovibrio piger ATCC 29098]